MHLELLKTRSEVATLGMTTGSLLAAAFRHPDATLTPQYFLASLEPNAEPRVVACYEHGQLMGVMYTSELYFCGMPTGFAFGGDRMGRGLIVAAPEREQEVFTAANAFLLDSGLHGMRLYWTSQKALTDEAIRLPGRSARIRNRLELHPEGDWLQLQPTYEQFLRGLGPHTRRNLRYYRRKVEAAGHAYSGLLQEAELPGALRSINHVADYPMDQSRLERDHRFFRAFETPIIAGLRSADGQVISLIIGFTYGNHLHILTQLNGETEKLRKLSLSLVLRGYLIEDFIQRGFTAVHFIHGSSPMLGRFCVPVPLQVVSIDDHRTLMTPLKKLCSRLAALMDRGGMRVPYRLQRCAGSYL